MIAPPTQNEAERIAALHRTGLLDSAAEKAYDEITSLAALICGVPIAVVSLIDTNRQWFKSKFGLEAPETTRDVSFCAHTILDSVPLIVPDATQDERFRDNPFVTENPMVRFYAGYPLANTEGHNLGALCVVDMQRRELTAAQKQSLEVLANQVVTLIALREQMQVAQREIARRQYIEAELKASEQRFRAFMDHSPATAFIKDEDGRYIYVNKLVCLKFNRREAEWLGRTDVELFGETVGTELRAIDRSVLESGQQTKVLESVPMPDGTTSHWQSYKFPFTDGIGRHCLAGMSLDVTSEKEREKDLLESEEKFRSVIERLAEGVYLIDNRTGRIVQANSALLAMLGYTLEELVHLRASDLFTGEDEGTTRQTEADASEGLAREGRHDLGRRMYRCKDGSILDVYIQLGRVGQGEDRLTSVIVRDITEQRRYEDRLEDYQRELESANLALRELATTDALTGVKNRAAFNDRLTHEIERSHRYGRAVSLLLLDVDHFKTFNDTFGHPAGDDVLKSVAAALKRAIRECDFVARYGGEEFAVILPETERGGAVVIAERCRKVIAEMHWPKRAITVSIGASTVAGSGATPLALIEEADVALYRSKKNGRNQVHHAAAGTSTIGTSIQ